MKSDGVLVNGRQIAIGEYLRSEHGRNMVHQMWSKRSQTPTVVRDFELKDAQSAFRSIRDPFSTVLTHDYCHVTEHVPINKKPAQLFLSEAEYVVIGGLGRYLCFWMAENGALHLTIISRSAVKDEKTERDFAKLMNMGASILLLKADAYDRRALSQALAVVRNDRPNQGRDQSGHGPRRCSNGNHDGRRMGSGIARQG